MRHARPNAPLVLGVLLLVGLLLFLALPWFVPVADPAGQTLTAEVAGTLQLPPYGGGQAGFLLGSDPAGRDMLARLVYGARTSLLLAMAITAIRVVVAVPLGLVAGWYRGLTGRLSEGASAMFGALPTLILVLFLVQSVKVIASVEGMTWLHMSWPYLYVGLVAVAGVPRLVEHVRRLTADLAVRSHIEAAVAVGAPPVRIMARHIWPLLRGDVFVAATAEIGWVLMLLGQMAIFGVYLGGTIIIAQDGVPPIIVERDAELGAMLGVNRHLLRRYPEIPLYPAAALGLIVACFQLLADGLRLRWRSRG